MAKQHFIKDKPHVNIGTIGHIDHGKTTLSRRFFLASVISLEMGCCAPVRMMGLSAFWMR